MRRLIHLLHPLLTLFRREVKQPEGLIGVLLDPDAEGDWDDAAMDLGDFDEPEAEHALFKVATGPGIDDDLADTCGHSLARIWCREGSVSPQKLTQLHPVARKIACATIEALRPDLLPEQ